MPPKSKPDDGAADGGAAAGGAAGQMDPVLQQQLVVASTFANLELQSTKSTLAQYVAMFNNLKEENAKLTLQIQERERDAMLVAQFLRTDLEKAHNQIKDLHKQRTDDLDAANRKALAVQQDLQGTIQQQSNDIIDLKREVEKLRSDLDALESFRRERQELHGELAQFREQHAQAVETYEAEISKQRFLSLEERVRLKATERDMATRFEQDVKDRAMLLLDARTKQIHQENFQLLQDKVLVERELQRIAADQQQLATTTATQKRDLELLKANEEEHYRRAVTANRTIQELRTRIATLEKQLADTLQLTEATKSRTLEDRRREVGLLEAERQGALIAAKTTHKELVRVRQLAAHVVRQRSDLEAFFNEALDYVRHEAAREAKQKTIAAKPVLAIEAGPTGGSLRRASKDKEGSSGSKPPLLLSGESPLVRAATGGSSSQPQPPPEGGDAFFGAGFEPIFSDTIGSRVSGESRGQPASRQQQQGGPAAGVLRPAAKPLELPPIAPAAGGRSVGRGSAPTASSTRAQQQQPPIAESPAASDGGPLDIHQLSWAEKERVIRILFAKINAGGFDRKSTMQQQSSIAAIDAIGTVEQRRRDPTADDGFFVTQSALTAAA